MVKCVRSEHDVAATGPSGPRSPSTLIRGCTDNSDNSEHFLSKMSREGEVINPEITR